MNEVKFIKPTSCQRKVILDNIIAKGYFPTTKSLVS